MSKFISLISFTQRGEEAIKNTVDRASAFREEASRLGASVIDIYWTLGNYDGVIIFDAPDDETATALMLGLSTRGNVRTQTLLAYDSDQMGSILSRVS